MNENEYDDGVRVSRRNREAGTSNEEMVDFDSLEYTEADKQISDFDRELEAEDQATVVANVTDNILHEGSQITKHELTLAMNTIANAVRNMNYADANSVIGYCESAETPESIMQAYNESAKDILEDLKEGFAKATNAVITAAINAYVKISSKVRGLDSALKETASDIAKVKGYKKHDFDVKSIKELFASQWGAYIVEKNATELDAALIDSYLQNLKSVYDRNNEYGIKLSEWVEDVTKDITAANPDIDDTKAQQFAGRIVSTTPISKDNVSQMVSTKTFDGEAFTVIRRDGRAFTFLSIDMATSRLIVSRFTVAKGHLEAIKELDIKKDITPKKITKLLKDVAGVKGKPDKAQSKFQKLIKNIDKDLKETDNTIQDVKVLKLKAAIVKRLVSPYSKIIRENALFLYNSKVNTLRLGRGFHKQLESLGTKKK